MEPVTSIAPKPQKLSKIKVYNLTGLIKEIDLGQSYFNQQETTFSGKRLKLDYVQVNEAANRYSFTYLEPDNLPDKYSRQADMWGFYTYPFSNEGPGGTFLPEVIVQDPNNNSHYLTFPGVKDLDQKTDTTGEFAKKGILTSIAYPTKGRTDFEYEVHGFKNGPSIISHVSYNAILDYTDPDPENYIVEPIKTFTLTYNTVVHLNSSTDYHEEVTNVAYLKNEQGAYLFIFDNQNNSSTTMLLAAGVYTLEAKYIVNHRTELQGTYDITIGNFRKGNGIRIKSITNYADNNTISGKKSFIYTSTGEANDPWSSGLLLKTLKNYYVKAIYYQDQNTVPTGGVYMVRTSSSIIPAGFYSQPNVVGYDKVCVKEGVNGDKGSTIYNYYNQEYDNQDLYPEIPEMFDSRNGQLLSVEIIDANGNLVKKTEYEYELKEIYSVKGVKVYKAPFDNTENFSYVPDVHYYDNYSEWWVQSSKIESSYFNNNSTVMIDTFKYNYNNSLHKQITSSEITQSDNTKRITFYKYPHDFVNQQPYTDMVNTKHIWSPVIEQSTYKDLSNFLQSSKTNYNYWYNNAWGINNSASLVVPQTVETKTLTNNPEIRLRYDSYDDKGNVTTVSKENDAKASYVWGYNKAYPIAEVVNAQVKDIFHTSFEDVEGNSTNGDSKTGKKSRTGGYNKTLSNLIDGQYVLSYWQKAGSVWNLQKSNITVSGNSYAINLSDQVDEVRFYPFAAQITTYTFEPLIGMTSQCNVNNRITYYEYDGVGRLFLIRDQDRNILKKFCYNYSGQTETCNIFYNVEKTQSFTKNDCASCTTPTSVVYTVPANKYFSTSQEEANALAQSEIDQNGQNYANQNGTCTPVLAAINSYNSTEYSVSVSFYNTSTFVTYDYTAPIGSNSQAPIIPCGNYNISMSPGISGTYTYYINGYSTQTSGTANFSNIPIGGTITMTIGN